MSGNGNDGCDGRLCCVGCGVLGDVEMTVGEGCYGPSEGGLECEVGDVLEMGERWLAEREYDGGDDKVVKAVCVCVEGLSAYSGNAKYLADNKAALLKRAAAARQSFVVVAEGVLCELRRLADEVVCWRDGVVSEFDDVVSDRVFVFDEALEVLSRSCVDLMDGVVMCVRGGDVNEALGCVEGVSCCVGECVMRMPVVSTFVEIESGIDCAKLCELRGCLAELESSDDAIVDGDVPQVSFEVFGSGLERFFVGSSSYAWEQNVVTVRCRDAMSGDVLRCVCAEDVRVSVVDGDGVAVVGCDVHFGVISEAGLISLGFVVVADVDVKSVCLSVSVFGEAVCGGLFEVCVGYGCLGDVVRSVGVEGGLFGYLAVSLDEEWFAVGCGDEVVLYSVESGSETARFGSRGKGALQFYNISSLLFVPDRNTLLVAEDMNNLLQEVTVGGEFVRFIGADVFGYRLPVRLDVRDDIMAVSCSFGDGPSIVLFEYSSGRLIRQFGEVGTEPHQLGWYCDCIRFTPDGGHVVVSSRYDSNKVTAAPPGLSMFTLGGEYVRRILCDSCGPPFTAGSREGWRQFVFVGSGDIVVAETLTRNGDRQHCDLTLSLYTMSSGVQRRRHVLAEDKPYWECEVKSLAFVRMKLYALVGWFEHARVLVMN